MNDFKQAERAAVDGQVSIERDRLYEDQIQISCTHAGQRNYLVCSDYNAARLFGLLSVMLGIKLPDDLAKRIKM